MAAVRHLPVPPGLGSVRWAAASRLRLAAGACYPPHRHSAPELFWIEDGRCRHSTAAGEALLGPGELAFLAPAQVHSLAAADAAGCTLANVVLAPALVAALAARWRSLLGWWPWEGAEPGRRTLEGQDLAALSLALDDLIAGPDRLGAEAFVLDLLRRCRRPAAGSGDPAPSWLRRAERAFAEPGRAGGAVAGFVHLCGRSTGHVNRAVRRHRGCTLTSLVTRLRIGRACQLLRIGDDPVPAVASACGFAALPHFYRTFRRLRRTTPAAYRAAERALAPTVFA